MAIPVASVTQATQYAVGPQIVRESGQLFSFDPIYNVAVVTNAGFRTLSVSQGPGDAMTGSITGGQQVVVPLTNGTVYLASLGPGTNTTVTPGTYGSTVSGGGGAQTLVPVAGRGNAYHQQLIAPNTISAGAVVVTYRVGHPVTADTDVLTIPYGNHARQSTGYLGISGTLDEIPNVNSIDLRVGVEVPGLNAPVPALCNGKQSVTIDPGAIVYFSVYGPFSKGDVIFTRNEVTVAATGNFFPIGLQLQGGTAGVASANGGGRGEGMIAGSAFAYSGTIPAVTGSYCYSPMAILGTPKSGSVFGSVALDGDSTSSPSQGGALWDYSALLRKVLPVADLVLVGQGAPGESASGFAKLGGKRAEISRRCDNTVIQYGVNDLRAGGGNMSAAAVMASLVASAKACYVKGKRVFLCTVLPMATDGGSGFATLAGQNLNANEAARQTVNNWIRAGAPVSSTTLLAVSVGTAGSIPCPYVYGYFECADTLESARDSGKWKIGSTVYSGTVTTGSNGANNAVMQDTVMGAQSANNAFVGFSVLFKTGANAGLGARINASAFGQLQPKAFPNPVAIGDTFDVVAVLTEDGLHPTELGYNAEKDAFDPAVFLRTTY